MKNLEIPSSTSVPCSDAIGSYYALGNSIRYGLYIDDTLPGSKEGAIDFGQVTETVLGAIRRDFARDLAWFSVNRLCLNKHAQFSGEGPQGPQLEIAGNVVLAAPDAEPFEPILIAGSPVLSIFSENGVRESRRGPTHRLQLLPMVGEQSLYERYSPEDQPKLAVRARGPEQYYVLDQAVDALVRQSPDGTLSTVNYWHD